jgi:hypothetical protein
MHVFIKKTFCFFAGFLVTLFVVSGLLNKYAAQNKFYSLKNAPTTIIAGNSRPECAFNDSLIAGAVNVAGVAEPYFYTYIKLRKLLKANTGIKNVLLEVGNNVLLDSSMNQWVYGKGSIEYLYPKYAPLMTFSEKAYLFQRNSFEFIKSIPLNIKNNFVFFSSRQTQAFTFKLMGGYTSKAGSHINELMKEQKPGNNYLSATSLAAFNLACLDKILLLCKAYKINICFIQSPVHPAYDLSAYKTTYDSVLTHRYSDVQLIDFSNFKLTDDEYFDFHHLNQKGARKVSLAMDSLLRLMNGDTENLQLTQSRIPVIN